MNKVLPYKLLFAGALASATLPSPSNVLAADLSQVKAVREYVIQHGQRQDVHEGGKYIGTAHTLVLEGNQIGYIPDLQFSQSDAKPYRSEIKLQTASGPNVKGKLFVTVKDRLPEKAGKDAYEAHSEVAMIQDGGTEGLTLDGVVDHAVDGREILIMSKEYPTKLQSQFVNIPLLSKVDMNDETRRNKIQSLYDKVIAGVYNLIGKR